MIALVGSGALLGTLAAIAVGVAGSSWARRRREPERPPAGRLAAGDPRGGAQPAIEIQFEDGRSVGRELRFQAIVAEGGAKQSSGLRTPRASDVRVHLRKVAGPASPLPNAVWRAFGAAHGPELVLDGVVRFDDADEHGLRFGEYELVVEWVGALGRLRATAAQRFRVGYVETFRRPAHAIFSGSSSWSTTSRGELKGQGPADGALGAIRLRQTFAGHDELAVRLRLRYEATDPPERADPVLDLVLAGAFTARLCPGGATPIELRDADGPLAGAGDSVPVFLGHGERRSELRLDFRCRREGPRTRLLLFVDGLLASSVHVPSAAPQDPWTIGLACRGMTVYVEELLAEALSFPGAEL